MKYLLIGVAAAVALGAGPLGAQGKGHGQGQPGGHGNAAHGPSMHGPKMDGPKMDGPAAKGPSMRSAAHGQSPHASGSMASAMQAAAPAHGRREPGAHGRAHARGGGRPGPDHARPAMAHAARPAAPPAKGDGGARPANAANGARPGIEVLQDGRRLYSERGSREGFDFTAARRGPIGGCPPGLARKANGCRPPGQARQRSYQPDWWGLGGIAGGPYVYRDGYLLRLNGDTVASYLPLLGGALAVGNLWPSSYAPLPVPRYYADYYDLGPPGGYRYADDVLYRVDPSNAPNLSIAALLTGDDCQTGSPMPPGYDVENVPYR